MSTSPLVTIIMPVRNEETAISRSVSAALSQDYPHEKLEVLVADGRSDDATREVLSEIRQTDSRLQIVDNPGRIMAAGFNAALSKARGEVVIMLGGHTEVAQDYVSKCVEALLRTGADCVGGPIETVCEDDWGRAIAKATSSRIGVGGVAFRTGSNTESFVDTVAFGAYRREAMNRIGDLDAELVRNQDDEYNYRLRSAGGKILLSPDIRCRYYGRARIRSLWRQYYQYGYWKIRVMQKHLWQMRLRHFVPAAFVLALMTGLVFVPLGGIYRISWVSFAGLYVLVILFGSLLTVGLRDLKWFPLVSLAFVTLHLSYGLGFLRGIVRFWRNWLKKPNGPPISGLRSDGVELRS